MTTSEIQTIDSALDSFLGEEIAIPTNVRQKAATSQIHIRNILSGKEDRDQSFPKFLRTADCDFLGGSFARHTKIWPLDDIDIFVPLDGANLIYLSGSLRLPFKLASDAGGTFNRLSLAQYTTGGLVDSSKILTVILNALSVNYPNSEIGIDLHCVNVQTAIAASTDCDGIGFDIVPCFLLKPDNGSENFYLVPDGNGGWMRSNPRKDTDLCLELHRYHDQTLRKAVRLLKYWNKKRLSSAFKSYYIELALLKHFDAVRQSNRKYVSVAGALCGAFDALWKAYVAGALTSLVTAAPEVRSPLLNSDQISRLTDAVARSNSAFHTTDPMVACRELNKVFGTGFFS
jgi:hypothetical protein